MRVHHLVLRMGNHSLLKNNVRVLRSLSTHHMIHPRRPRRNHRVTLLRSLVKLEALNILHTDLPITTSSRYYLTTLRLRHNLLVLINDRNLHILVTLHLLHHLRLSVISSTTIPQGTPHTGLTEAACRFHEGYEEYRVLVLSFFPQTHHPNESNHQDSDSQWKPRESWRQR